MTIEQALNRLGYTQKWIDFEIISPEYLLAQYDEILSSQDQNAEHYRCGGFADYLRSKDTLTDKEVLNIFELDDNGPDLCDLHENRVIELIYSDILSNKQLKDLSIHKEVLEAPIQRLYFRKKLIHKIKAHGIDQCFEEIKLCQDSQIHDFILTQDDLNYEHILWLSINGTNKRIRNITKQLANRRIHK